VGNYIGDVNVKGMEVGRGKGKTIEGISRLVENHSEGRGNMM
jgi:hypothetical protein